MITLNPTFVQILTLSDSEEDTIVGDRLGVITLTPKSLTQTSTQTISGLEANVSDRSGVITLTLESHSQTLIQSGALNSGIKIEYMSQTHSSRISGVDMLVAESRWYGFRDYLRRCK